MKKVLLGCLLTVVLGWLGLMVVIVVIVNLSYPHPVSSGRTKRIPPPTPSREATEPTKHQEVSKSPLLMVSTLKNLYGFEDGLSGRGWHKSRLDDTWIAILRKPYGRNEISCLIESSSHDTMERVELEAEFYDPGPYDTQMLTQFAKLVAAFHPEADMELAQAIVDQRPWTNGTWHLRRERYPNTPSGYGLMFTNVTRSTN